VAAIILSVTSALTLMAIMGLTISPMWLAAPLLAMGYGLDDMFVLVRATFFFFFFNVAGARY
jgi:preprotein translocase subunit SecF